ncbi:MAG: serine/threonine protein kinase [Leptolyngbyaceae cyanobacterium SL_5_14]|nr:serine/threonine protein kinase [Leptolyngbyaceae cyanobacterium SL_5_14]
MQISPSTLRNFLKGIPVDREIFKLICEGLGLKWNDVADPGADEDAAEAEPHQDEILVYPEGSLPKTSRLYVQRPGEERALVELCQPGGLVRIYAPRRMGKTSLLSRLLGQAEGLNAQSAYLDLTQAGEAFGDLASFLKWFCDSVALEVKHDVDLDVYEQIVERYGSSHGCKIYFKQYLLPEVEQTVFLGLDRVDELIKYPELCREFLGLLRLFREDSRHSSVFAKLRLILVYSKDIEVYVPLPIDRSPFSVGFLVELPEFTAPQVLELAELYRLQWSDTEVQSLMSLVGGHPFLVRLALYHIACQDTTLPELLETAPSRVGYYGEYLQVLSQKPELLTAMQKVVAGDSTDLNEITQHDLYSLGLVKFEGNAVIPSCELYRQYYQNLQ